MPVELPIEKLLEICGDDPRQKIPILLSIMWFLLIVGEEKKQAIPWLEPEPSKVLW